MENSREDRKRLASLTLYDELNKHIPTSWKANFKTNFIIAHEKMPESSSTSLIIPWNFQTASYSLENLNQEQNTNYPIEIAKLKELLEQISNIPNINPFEIKINHLIVFWVMIFIGFGVFLGIYFSALLCEFQNCKHFQDKFWLFYLMIFPVAFISIFYVLQNFFRHLADKKWFTREKILCSGVHKFNIMNDIQFVLKIGAASAWFKYRQKSPNDRPCHPDHSDCCCKDSCLGDEDSNDASYYTDENHDYDATGNSEDIENPNTSRQKEYAVFSKDLPDKAPSQPKVSSKIFSNKKSAC